MPITINGTGSITGISAGGLPDACITTDDLAANAVTTAKMGTSEASGLAKAWVNFNGTGTVAIRANYNVSSITDNGTGSYTVNFTTALADANFSAVATTGFTGVAFTVNSEVASGATRSTNFVNVEVQILNGSNSDALQVNVAIFR